MQPRVISANNARDWKQTSALDGRMEANMQIASANFNDIFAEIAELESELLQKLGSSNPFLEKRSRPLENIKYLEGTSLEGTSLEGTSLEGTSLEVIRSVFEDEIYMISIGWSKAGFFLGNRPTKNAPFDMASLIQRNYGSSSGTSYWKIDHNWAEVEEGGWTYATDRDSLNNDSSKGCSSVQKFASVRRRKWIYVDNGAGDLDDLSGDIKNAVFQQEKFETLSRTWKSKGFVFCAQPTVAAPDDLFDPNLTLGNPWKIDLSCVSIDPDGWTYAYDFDTLNKSGSGDSSPKWNSYVRRRKWKYEEERAGALGDGIEEIRRRNQKSNALMTEKVGYVSRIKTPAVLMNRGNDTNEIEDLDGDSRRGSSELSRQDLATNKAIGNGSPRYLLKDDHSNSETGTGIFERKILPPPSPTGASSFLHSKSIPLSTAQAKNSTLLKLKSSVLGSSWQERYVVCDNENLFQFHHSERPSGTIESSKPAFTAFLKESKVETAPQLRPFSFIVHNANNGKITLAAQDKNIYNSWISHLEKYCKVEKKDTRVSSNISSSSISSSGIITTSSSGVKLHRPIKMIPFEKLSIADPSNCVVGKGNFGTVVKAELSGMYSHSVKQQVAAKIMIAEGSNAEEILQKMFEAAMKELEIMIQIEEKGGPNSTEHMILVIGIASGQLPPSFEDAFGKNKKAVAVVMRLESGGELLKYLMKPGYEGLHMVEKLNLIKKLSRFLAEIHEAGVVHGDIKTSNILLSGHAPPDVRLGDFGESTISRGGRSVDLSTTSKAHGTPLYSAPEMLSVDIHTSLRASTSRATDMYAFGLVCYEVLCKKYKKPFQDFDVGECEAKLIEVVVNKNLRPNIEDILADVPESLKEMIKACWSKRPEDRPTAHKCYLLIEQCYNVISNSYFDIFLSHPWTKKVVLQYVKLYFNSIGYKVWYDLDNMQWDLVRSMQEGILKSKVFLACISEEYENSKNCMFELAEAYKLGNKTIVTLSTDENPFSWVGKNTSHGDLKLMCGRSGQGELFIDIGACIGEICARPGWELGKDDETLIPKKDIADLNSKLGELVKVLQGSNIRCIPTLALGQREEPIREDRMEKFQKTWKSYISSPEKETVLMSGLFEKKSGSSWSAGMLTVFEHRQLVLTSKPCLYYIDILGSNTTKGTIEWGPSGDPKASLEQDSSGSWILSVVVPESKNRTFLFKSYDKDREENVKKSHSAKISMNNVILVSDEDRMKEWVSAINSLKRLENDDFSISEVESPTKSVGASGGDNK